MPKKPVAVTLRKPQAPDLDSFVGGHGDPAPARAPSANPIESGADVKHGARDYREMTLYLPVEVVRELSFYCMDRNCDINRAVAEAVSKHVTREASEPTASNPGSRWGGTLELLVEQLRAKLSTLWALR